ncbi:MAG: hypothetical protein EBZ47_10075, partial [Chlamydiae bacterium]|nr:hypothetical protein [Chlamydiota bacterium]
IRETRVWIDLIIEAYKTGDKNKKDLKTFKQKNQPLLDYLDVLENKLNSHIPQLLIQREKSLKTDFTFQIEKIKEAMQVILFEFVKINKKIPLLSFSIGKKVFKKISQRLSETQQIILAHRSQFEKKVIEKGCNILIEKLDLYPYPLLYTTKGNIYVIQETMEHFVGVGNFKIVSRTFEMQEGHVRALIRPKKLFEETMTEEELYDEKENYFFRSFIESDLLRHVKNKPGIINQFEASGFKQKDDKSFYQICELFDSLELTKLLIKIRTKDPLAPNKESIIAIAKDMILGLLSLKSSGLIHRDLKDDNILVHTSSLHLSAGARFIDFNIACLESQLAAHVMFPVASIAPPEFCKVFLDTNFTYTSNEYASITGFSQDTWAI